MNGGEIIRIRTLAGGGGDATVELVEVGGRQLVLKRSTRRKALAEARFQTALAEADLPSLEIVAHPDLGDDELLLEYLEGSPTIGGSPSPERSALWGAAVRAMHQVKAAEFQALDDEGRIVAAEWSDFLRGVIARGLRTQQQAQADGLPAAMVSEIERRLRDLFDFRPADFALAHGDLHVNNALLRGEDVILYDASAGVWVAPPVFDLALIHSEGFPGARYGVDRPGDAARMAAFRGAYGELPADQMAWLDHFVLAHSIMRYPHPFVPELRQVIEAALERVRG
jgi:Ser/Thr protein kinase RdoA (MazF antagonist)